jgi:protein-S-isoprenylcysteine O-methyltransferase Ste14
LCDFCRKTQKQRKIPTIVINPITYWTLIGIISFVLFIWAIITISRGILHEFLQVLGFILLVLSLTLTGSYSFIYSVGEEEVVYLSISLAFGFISLALILLGTLCARRRWVRRRGTANLNSFTNLLIFAYIRHPISLGLMSISLSIIFYFHSLLSNILAGIALIVFMFSSLEKDQFFKELYGYPYKVYIKAVPRFNFIYGFIKAMIFSRKVSADEIQKQKA